jgi:hypothetical protein
MPSLSSFLAVLDGLMLPHRASIRALRACYGARRSKYYGWDVIEVADAKPIVFGQVGAFYFTCNNDPNLLPPVSFSTFIAIDAEAHRNHAQTREALSALFGRAPEDRSASNTLGDIWRFESGALEILSWPPELNPRSFNPAVARHPELATFCHLRLTNGYLPPLTPTEADWLKEIAPFANQGPYVPGRIGRTDPWWNGVDRGVWRHLPEEMRGGVGVLGKSRDGQALVRVTEKEALVIPRADVRAVVHDRIPGDRGDGVSVLAIAYADRFSTIPRNLEETLFSAPKADGLDTLAKEIAAWAGVDVKRSRQ